MGAYRCRRERFRPGADGCPSAGGPPPIKAQHYEEEESYRASAARSCTAADEFATGGVKLGHTLTGYTGPVGRLAWSPDGRILASPSDDATIRLWDAETGECVRKLKRLDVGFECAAFDPTGNTLAASCYDGTVSLWNIADGSLKTVLEVGERQSE